MQIVIYIKSNSWNNANKELKKLEEKLGNYKYIGIDVEE